MLVLGIESTCDETGCAIVQDGKEILSNSVASQSDFHIPFGGVVPELAGRKQNEACLPVLKSALKDAQVSFDEIELIAVANGPGLIGSILVGLHFAKGLAWALKKPLVGVNHVEAHLYAPFMPDTPPLPALGVVISGGHTALYKIQAIGTYEFIGQTQDDAIGESFDKAARLLGLPYPGGPQLEKLAQQGDPTRYLFTQPLVKKNPFDFSFSGLKTAFLYYLYGQNGNKERKRILSDAELPHLAASFQHAAFSNLLDKALEAADKWNCQSVVFGGGVTSNLSLRKLAHARAHIPLFWPPPGLSQDNGAMIAGLGFHKRHLSGYESIFSLEAFPRCSHGLHVS